MYETFFGLKKRPFLTTPTLDRYFPTESMEQAFRMVSRSIERGDGPVAVMGGTGVGKSLLCLRVADAWRRNFEIILLSSSKLCTRRALLQNLLFELRMPYRDMSEGELRLSLTDRLQPSIENSSDGLLLIVDEAQTLSLKLLEELRLLTNLARDGVPRVRLVLVGNLRLDELIGHPRMESLNQRLASRCYLRNLTADETTRYLKHKIEISGAQASTVFTEEAFRAIHRSSTGIPRLIDQIADHALAVAASVSQKPISGSLIEKAWSELQQLPSPWLEATPANSVQDSTIEFGLLEEEEDKEFEPGSELLLDWNASAPILDQDEIFLEDVQPQNSFTFESFDSEISVQKTLLSYNTYELDDQITIEVADPSVSYLYAPQVPVERRSIMSDSLRATDPFGDDFEEEIAVPKQMDPAVEPALHSFEPDSNQSQLESQQNSIPVEPLENSLDLDVSTVENEIREMISSLQLDSVSIGLGDSSETPSEAPPTLSVPMPGREVHSGLNPRVGTGASLLAFANLGARSGFGGIESPTHAVGDDRDMLVVEEDMELRQEASFEATGYSESPRTPPHSYIQLFSKLRG